MPITDTVQARDVVFIQRANDNSAYGEVHVSGTLLIPYIDANGNITADTSASFYSLFPASGSSSGGTSLTTGSTYPITSSWAQTSSIAQTASVDFLTLDSNLYNVVPKFGSTGKMGASNITVTNAGTVKINSSGLTAPPLENILYIGRDGNSNTWAGMGLYNDAGGANAKYWINYADQSNVLEFSAASDDFATINPWLTITRNGAAISQILFQKPVTFVGNILPSVTNTYSVGTQSLYWKDAYIVNVFGTSSYATSASFATRSIIAVSASWASSSISSSHAISASWAPPIASDFAISASWSSRSLSSSISDLALTASYFVGSITDAIYAVSASWASSSLNSNTSSFATRSLTATSASWASNSIWATSASYASRSSHANSASWASQSLSAFYASASNSASYADSASNSNSSSWAVSASWAPGSSGGTTLFTGSTYEITASWAISASWAPPIASNFAISASWASQSLSSSLAQTASYLLGSVQSANVATSASWASSSISASYASQSFLAETASLALTSSYPWALSSLGIPYHSLKPVSIGAQVPTSASRLHIVEPTTNSATMSVVTIYGSRNDGNTMFVDIRNTQPTSVNAFAGLNLLLGTSSFEGGRIFVTRAATPASGIVNGLNFSPNTSSADIGFRVGVALAGGVAGPTFQIKNTGMMGMGVATPSAARLHLGGTEIPLYGATIRLSNGNAGGADSFIASTDNGWGGASGNKFVVGTGDPSAGGVTKLQIDLDTGNLGVNMPSGTDPAATLDVVGNISASTVTASFLLGTASWAVHSLTASIALQAFTSSLAIAAISSSWASASISSSYADSASNSNSSSWAVSASWAPGASGGTTLFTGSTYEITASWAISASWAPTSPSNFAISASWASASISSSWANSSSVAYTASFATSASWAPGAGTQIDGKVIVLCAAYTPSLTGADYAEIPVPYSPNDGTTAISWSVKRINIRVQMSGSSTSSVTIEKSTGAGIFTPVSLGTVNLLSASYEAFTGSIGTIISGDKVRFNVNTLGTAQNWTLTTEIASI